MPQVPYSPVPQVPQADIATPGVRPSVPIGAFGGEVAQAVQSLGTVTEQAGNELFARAVALKQLGNETEAREADAQYMIKAGDLHAKFNALEGQERVKAFPQYAQDLQDLRTKLRAGLSNDMARRMYDSSSLSTMGRSIFNGAGAAATAQKEAAHSAANAQFDLNVKSSFDNPNSDEAFEAAIRNNHQSAVTRAALSPGGASPERVELLTRQGDSTIAANRILGMARNQPYQASKLLEEYKTRGLLFGRDYEVVSNKVQSLTQTVGTNVIANQVLGKYLQSDGTYSKPATEMQAEAVKIAKETYPDDPKMETAAAAAFDHNYNQHQWAKLQDDRAVVQELNNYIVKGVTTTDLLPPDLVKRMTPKQIREFPAAANSYRRSVDVQTNQDAREKLLGLYNNDNNRFMDTNVMTFPGLSLNDRKYFVGLQRQTAANGDPRVSAALKTLRGAVPQTLESLGIYRRDPRNPEDYDRFTGALHEAIQAWHENTGKPPNEQQLTKEIFPNLIMQTTDPERWFGRKSELFKAGIPEEAKAAIAKDLGREPTDEEVRQHYLRERFNKLFGQRAKSQDRVP